MALTKPYPKIYRHGPPNTLDPFFDDSQSQLGRNNIAAYELLKSDLKEIFEFIEPSATNYSAFSHRNYEILLRACTEVESLCKQIFTANGQNADNIIQFSDLDGAMKLSSYIVKSYGFLYPEFSPFDSFFSSTPRQDRSPSWYKAYNKVKHNRQDNFSFASLNNAIEAVGGVYVLLVAMYGMGFDHTLKMSWHHHHMVDTPTFFRVLDYPKWDATENYVYDWNILKLEADNFEFHLLPNIP